MRHSIFAVAAGAMIAACAHGSAPEEVSSLATASESSVSRPVSTPLQYPEAKRGEVVDVYHGVSVPDPYRWLEDPDGAATRAWIEAENALTFGWLDEVEARSRIRERLTQLWDFEKYGVPFEEGGKYFYRYNPGLLNQSILYVMDSLDAEGRVLLDPNTFSEDGTVALTGISVSPDGKYLAYAVSSGGSDWKEWRVRDIASGTDLPDHVQWSKFSGASWTDDSKGFYYSAYDAPADPSKKLTGVNYYQKLYYHQVGTTQDQDLLVYEREDQKEWGFEGHVTDDGRWLVIHVSRGTDPKNGVFYQDLSAAEPQTVELLAELDARYEFVGSQGSVFYFVTDLDAPRGRIIAIDVNAPERASWKELVAQGTHTLETANLVGGHIVATYMVDAKDAVRIYDLAGKLVRTVELPGIGSTSGFGGKADDPETFFAFTGFTHPKSIYRYNVQTGESELFREPKVDFDPRAYETKQVFYESKDGTRVPMFVVHKRGVELDGANPTFLYGYGGFNISLTPWFSITNLVWLEMGGVYAMPNLRGGGEYGEAWHQGGIKLRKQNVFDDFLAAAEWLIDNGWTSSDKLAIGGGSNGGLLVGAAITQRPELFAAAAPAVGVLDMLRYHEWTIGWAWASDYGTSDDPEEFAALFAYSPYHNVKQGTSYPATFITTGDHDDRVVPAHSFKFAAALQAAQAGSAPVLIRIETRAGHGAGKPTQKIIEEIADRLAFFVRVLEMRP